MTDQPPPDLSRRLDELEKALTHIKSNVDVDLTTRLNKLEADNANVSKALRELQSEIEAPPELSGLVELVSGHQQQLGTLQELLAAASAPVTVDVAPDVTREIDRREIATRAQLDDAIRKLSTTLRQYVRDHVQQALRPRPSVAKRVLAALLDRQATSPQAPPSDPAMAAVAEQAEQALRRGR